MLSVEIDSEPAMTEGDTPKDQATSAHEMEVRINCCVSIIYFFRILTASIDCRK